MNCVIHEGFFNPEPIRTMWIDHLGGKKLAILPVEYFDVLGIVEQQ